MTAKLIIRLHVNHTFDWQHIDGNNQVIAEAYQQAELQVPTNLINTTVILLVPGIDVTLLNVKIPKTNRAQLLRALPYAIEEKLCEDIEDLHFAIGQWQKIGGEELLAVAVTSNKKMAAWLALCETANIRPHQIIPDVLALPYLADQWTCAIENSLLLIRTGQQNGIATDINNAAFVLKSLLEKQAPQAVVVEDYDQVSFANLFVDITTAEVKINAKPKPFLANALNGLNNAINLLQGPYKAAANAFRFSAEWCFTLQLAVVALVLFVIAETANYIALKSENSKLDTQISALSQSLMLSGNIDNSAKPRIERELHLLARLGKGNGFLSLINKVGDSLKQARDINVEQMAYQNNLLVIRVNANNKQTLSTWLSSLRSAHINIVSTNMNINNQVNSAEITIKGS